MRQCDWAPRCVVRRALMGTGNCGLLERIMSYPHHETLREAIEAFARKRAGGSK